MVDRRLIIEWLAKADEDYGFASSVIKDSVYYGQICFHYQQAAEKYLKGLYRSARAPL
jgi:HEPN domain-containing protein